MKRCLIPSAMFVTLLLGSAFASAQAARDQFYRTLHRHADGVGTIEDVEGAYRELLPFRR